MTQSNLEILAYEKTPLGMLCLRRRRPLQDPNVMLTEITLNHEFLMSSYYTDSERALSQVALGLHAGEQLSVLVGGLGLGYTAFEALKDKRVRQLDVIEYLPPVIDWIKQGLVPLSEELNADQRLNIIESDVYKHLAGEPVKKYDLILIDVDHSPDERLDSNMGFFYTHDGLIQAKNHLNSDGVLAVWSYAEDSPFADALRRVFDEVRIESVSFDHKYLNNETHTDWLFFAR